MDNNDSLRESNSSGSKIESESQKLRQSKENSSKKASRESKSPSESFAIRAVNKLWDKMHSSSTESEETVSLTEYLKYFLETHNLSIKEGKVYSNSVEGAKILENYKFWIPYIFCFLEDNSFVDAIKIFEEGLNNGADEKMMFEYFNRWFKIEFLVHENKKLSYNQLPEAFKRLIDEAVPTTDFTIGVLNSIDLLPCSLGSSPSCSKCSQTIEKYPPKVLELKCYDKELNSNNLNLSIVEEELDVSSLNLEFPATGYTVEHSNFNNHGFFAILRKENKIYAVPLQNFKEVMDKRQIKKDCKAITTQLNYCFLPYKEEAVKELQEYLSGQ